MSTRIVSTSAQSRPIGELALPDSDHSQALRAQCDDLAGVTFTISEQLAPPETYINARYAAAITMCVPMPEAAIHEHHLPTIPVGYAGAGGKPDYVSAISNADGGQKSAHLDFC